MTILNPGTNPETMSLDQRLPGIENNLLDSFYFDLKEHQLTDPEASQGSVVSVEKVEPVSTFSLEALPRNIDVYEINIVDPYVAADPEGYTRVNAHIEHMETEMATRGFNPLEERSEAQTREQRNEYTNAWLHQANLSGLSVWRDNVPTANALGYLTNPLIGAPVSNHKKGESLVEDVISPETAAFLRFVDDAVAIRDRAVAMQHLAEEHIATAHTKGEVVRWLSLASGTAEPSIKAAKNAMEKEEVSVDLTVADIDGNALKFVKHNAETNDFGGNVNTVLTNILAEDLSGTLAEQTGTEAMYDVVENMGFEEYLPQEGDELGAVKGAGLPQASEFTRRAYDMVKPGGMLISGNMVLDRPQIGFVFGIVDWPVINARSEESILRVYKEAGILDDPNAKVEMYRVRNATTQARLYNIIRVTKRNPQDTAA